MQININLNSIHLKIFAHIFTLTSLVVSGILLSEIPIIKTGSVIRIDYDTKYLKLKASTRIFILGFIFFIPIFFITGFICDYVKSYLFNIGVNVHHFEANCIFSSFLLIIGSVIANLWFFNFRNKIAPKAQADYIEIIEKLSKEKDKENS